MAHICEFPKGGLVLPSSSHPLDSLFLVVHLKSGIELSDHGFIPIVVEPHDVLHPNIFNLGQQPLEKSLVAHSIPPDPLLVGTH